MNKQQQSVKQCPKCNSEAVTNDTIRGSFTWDVDNSDFFSVSVDVYSICRDCSHKWHVEFWTTTPEFRIVDAEYFLTKADLKKVKARVDAERRSLGLKLEI